VRGGDWEKRREGGSVLRHFGREGEQAGVRSEGSGKALPVKGIRIPGFRDPLSAQGKKLKKRVRKKRIFTGQVEAKKASHASARRFGRENSGYEQFKKSTLDTDSSEGYPFYRGRTQRLAERGLAKENILHSGKKKKPFRSGHPWQKKNKTFSKEGGKSAGKALGEEEGLVPTIRKEGWEVVKRRERGAH